MLSQRREVYQGKRSSAGKTELPGVYKHLMTGVSHMLPFGGGGEWLAYRAFPFAFGIRASRAGHAGGCVISNRW